MRSMQELLGSTIALKWMMALSGISLVLFLVAHLAGNLLIFMGPEDMNSYGHDLRQMLHGTAIWILRIGLAKLAVVHIVSALILTRRIRSARQVAYAKVDHQTSTVASRTMALSGILLLTYAVYHLAHFTWGIAHPEFYAGVYMLANGVMVHDVYAMVVHSFQQPVIVGTYVVAMVFTGFHLNHAISSAFQTMGISHPRYTPLIRKFGAALSILLVIGFVSVPLAIMAGMVH